MREAAAEEKAAATTMEDERPRTTRRAEDGDARQVQAHAERNVAAFGRFLDAVEREVAEEDE